jgi:hypothetical protein
MSATRRAAPATKPVAAKRVSTNKKPVKKAVTTKPVRKSAVKKTVVKKTVVKKPAAPKPAHPRLLKRAFRAKCDKTRASADARKATLDTTKAPAEPDTAAAPQTAAKPKPEPRPPRRSAVDRLDDSPPAAGAVLVERVAGAIERELTQIDAIVGKRVSKEQRTEAERRARTLASLARTLTEVRKLRADENRLKPTDANGKPRDRAQFRLELARRLDQIVARAKIVHPDGGGG